MVRCEDCGIRMRSPKSENWKIFKMCFKCAKKNHPEYYEDKRNHGVGGTYLDKNPQTHSMVVMPMATMTARLR